MAARSPPSDPEPLIWLLSSGRSAHDPVALIAALCDHLESHGFALRRLACRFPTLHPQIAGCAFVWTPETGACEECLPHSEASWASETASPGTVEHTPRADESAHTLDLPLLFSDDSAHRLTISTGAPRGFDAVQTEALRRLALGLAPVLEGLMTRRVAATLLDTYIGPRAGRRVLDGQVRRGDAECLAAAILFCDLRDSTALAERLPAAQLLATLNAYFEHVAAAVEAHGGEVLRLIGDGVLVAFPANAGGGLERACTDALAAATRCVDRLPELNARLSADLPALALGIGLHAGEVLYGNVGAPQRLDFTVTGPAVNTAARLQALTRSAGRPILMSEAFASRIERTTHPLGPVELKGIAAPAVVHVP